MVREKSRSTRRVVYAAGAPCTVISFSSATPGGASAPRTIGHSWRAGSSGSYRPAPPPARRSLLLGVAAPHEAALVQVGPELHEGIRQAALQLQVQLLRLKGGKARGVHHLRPQSRRNSSTCRVVWRPRPNAWLTSPTWRWNAGSRAFKMLDFPTPELPVKADTFPEISSRSRSSPSPVSALT